MAAMLGASLSFFACESPTDGAAGANAYETGDLTGSRALASVQDRIDYFAANGGTLFLDNDVAVKKDTPTGRAFTWPKSQFRL